MRAELRQTPGAPATTSASAPPGRLGDCTYFTTSSLCCVSCGAPRRVRGMQKLFAGGNAGKSRGKVGEVSNDDPTSTNSGSGGGGSSSNSVDPSHDHQEGRPDRGARKARVSSEAQRSRRPAAQRGRKGNNDSSRAGALAMIGGGGKRQSTMKSEEELRANALAQEVVTAFVYGVRENASAEEKTKACMDIAQYVNDAYSYTASCFGAHLRDSKGLAYILQLLYEGDLPSQRIGLMILSNLVSDAFDPKSSETKRQVLHAGVFERIKDFVYSIDTVAQTYAIACLQNLCKDLAFAKLMRQYELVEELERLVKISPNEHLRKYAAGALFNTVEAIHRAFALKSLDQAHQADAVGEGNGDEVSKRGTRGRVSSLMASMTGETADEVELSEEVLDELAKREAELNEERTLMEEAASLIQSITRQRKTKRAFRMLRALAGAVRIVARAVRSFQRRKRRKAALFVQCRFRAFICHTRGIAHGDTVIHIILCCREAHLRALCRMVHARFAMHRLEQKRREAERLVARYAPGRKSLNSKYDVPMVRRAQALKAAEASAKVVPVEAVGRPKLSSSKDPASAATQTGVGRFRRNASELRAKSQSFVKNLLPSASVPSIPTPSAVSARIPLFAGGARPGEPKPVCHGAVTSAVACLNTFGGASPGPAPGITSTRLPLARGAQATMSRSISIGSMLGSGADEVELRRSAAAAAKSILTLSDIQETTAEGRASSDGRSFPPGSSILKYNAFSGMAKSASTTSLVPSPGPGLSTLSPGKLPQRASQAGGVSGQFKSVRMTLAPMTRGTTGLGSSSMCLGTSLSCASLPRRGSYSGTQQMGAAAGRYLAADPTAGGTGLANSPSSINLTLAHRANAAGAVRAPASLGEP